MELLTGPPGSGKTHQVLERMRRTLAAGGTAARLIVPTATMAAHIGHSLAREGFALRPQAVTTLASFTAELDGVPAPLSAPVLDWLIERALAELDLREYRRVAGFFGFRSAVACVLEEVSLAGCTAEHLRAWRETQALGAVYEYVEQSAALRGEALPGARLTAAARALRRQAAATTGYLVDGFFHFNPRELDVLEALAAHGELTVTLPDWDGAAWSRERLLAMGMIETRLERLRARPEVEIVRAQNAEQEIEEIALRLLESRRPFWEMGIVVRTGGPYLPALRTAFGRFGIPARFYFPEPLDGRPRIRRWLAEVAATPGRRGAAEWDELASRLAGAALPGGPLEPGDRTSALLWRARAGEARQWRKMVDETAALFDPAASLPAAEFHRRLEAAARLTMTHSGDARRNVVHVIDAVEARQWELPVVHVCGLLEKAFPVYYSPDPVLPESQRRRLAGQGVPVQTAADWDRRERFLFEIATSRATERLVLSYPECNEKGEETLRSFFLDSWLDRSGLTERPARAARPAPGGPRLEPPPPEIRDEELKAVAANLHATTSPSAIEDFLQCPFLFFARRTLKIAGEDDPLGPRLQGDVAHAVLARWIRSREPVEKLVNAVFRSICEREGLAESYRTEAVRLDLVRNLGRFVRRIELEAGAAHEIERSFVVELGPGVTLRCRIDRIDVAPDGGAVIVDYKYSGPQHVKDIVEAHEKGTRVQGGLYILAARSAGYQVRGMRFEAIRNDQMQPQGWSEGLNGVVEVALAAAARAVEGIRQGVIRPQPADSERCESCEFRDICRVESAAAVLASGEGVR
jgi:ATP-dependent helicase/DNAse subunit B